MKLLKSTFLIFILLLFSSPSNAGNEPVLAIHSFEDNSCGAWVKSNENKFIRAQYFYWFRGFVSGYNFGNPDNQVTIQAMPNEETLYLYVDKYCRENPLKPFVSAAFKLVEELRENTLFKKGNSSKK